MPLSLHNHSPPVIDIYCSFCSINVPYPSVTRGLVGQYRFERDVAGYHDDAEEMMDREVVEVVVVEEEGKTVDMELEQLSVQEESVTEALTVGLVEARKSSMETASETAVVAEEAVEDDGAAVQVENMEKNNEEVDQGCVCVERASGYRRKQKRLG